MKGGIREVDDKPYWEMEFWRQTDATGTPSLVFMRPEKGVVANGEVM